MLGDAIASKKKNIAGIKFCSGVYNQVLDTFDIQSRTSLVPNSKIELGHSQYVRT